MAVINSFKGRHQVLSNFYLCATLVRGYTYQSVEHAFQASKSLDRKQQHYIAAALTGAEARRRGRATHPRDDWPTFRFIAMREALDAKFSNPLLKRQLLDTGIDMLVEGNRHHDNLWGNCTCERPSCAVLGTNVLGFMLMEVRARMRAKERGL